MNESLSKDAIASTSLLGLTVGRGSRPRIVSLDTASSFPALDNVWSIHFAESLVNQEDLNSGIQAHLYTRPGDTLVVRTHYWPVGSTELVPHLLELNARIWRTQTGLQLLGGEGHVSFVPDREGMLAHAVALYLESDSFDFLVPAVSPYLSDLLGGPTGPLATVTRASNELNRKNRCLPLLQQAGLPTPKTWPIERASFENSDFVKVLDTLPSDLKFVLKADGSSSGVGVNTNAGRGLTRRELRALIDELRRTSRLPRAFQIQEFRAGTSMGASGWIDQNAGVHIASVHKQYIEEASCRGAYWSPSIENPFIKAVSEFYSVIAEIQPAFRGPIGIDFIADGEQAHVIECNPRLTGTGPIGFLRSRASTGLGGTRAGYEKVHVETIDLRLNIPPFSVEALSDDWLLTRITEITSDQRLYSASQPPMILPQGLDPFRTNKVMFVNDPSGLIREQFLRLFET